ncbi:hypothetical protein FRB93_012225 [Tulasnella sp. JGI-2019a]|nr:hypothetical protein FRB93_012225 [Tulasnella sp. JGI-2019a]
MVYYTSIAIINLTKSAFGYKATSTPARIVPQNALHESPLPIVQAVEPATQPASGADNDDTRSIQSCQSTGNGATRKTGHAILRGSPKALGLNVDEAQEENAWSMLMGDAVEGSIHEQSIAGADEDRITSPIAPSNQDIIKFFAADRGESWVWRVAPSLTGAHQWTLHHQGDDEEVKEEVEEEAPQEPEVVRKTMEMQTDTMDLVEDSHQEIGTQTIVKTYCNAAVQVDEPEVAVPPGALSPLPESTDLVDVLPADLRPISPSATATATGTAVDSRPGTPDSGSRLPRLISRRGSASSFQTQSTRASPILSAVARATSTSPVPLPIASFQKPTRASSIRSFALRRASSKASMKPKAPAEATEATPKEEEVTPVVEKKKNGRFFDAVKRIGRTDSVVKAWKP